MFDINGVEIFAAGTWIGSHGPTKWSEDDIDAIVENTNMFLGSDKFAISPGLKIGHSYDQFWYDDPVIEAQEDGAPSLGKVTNFRTTGAGENKKIVADFTNVSPIIYRCIEGGMYTNVSAELEFSKGVGWFISAVALLGADIPAVKTLSDLQAFLKEHLAENSRVVPLSFSEPVINNGGKVMSKEHDNTDPVGKKDPAVTKLLEDNDKLRANYSDVEKKFEALQKEKDARDAELDKYRKQNLEAQFAQQKEKVLGLYKTDVEAKKLMPAVYDKIVACLDGQKEGFSENTKLAIDPELALEVAQAYSEKTPGEQEGQGGGAGVGDAQSSAPDEVLVRECKVIMNQHKMTYAEAAEHLQLTKPAIWADYHKWTDKVSSIGKVQAV